MLTTEQNLPRYHTPCHVFLVIGRTCYSHFTGENSEAKKWTQKASTPLFSLFHGIILHLVCLIMTEVCSNASVKINTLPEYILNRNNSS